MRRIVIFAAVAAFAMAACGDDDETAGEETTTTSAASVTSTTASAVVTTTIRSPTSPPRESSCGTVGFTPNSEDAASEIKATGVTCDEAKAFVRVAGTRTSSGGPPSVNVEGYRCVLTRSVEDPLPQAFYECTNDTVKITFTRS